MSNNIPLNNYIDPNFKGMDRFNNDLNTRGCKGYCQLKENNKTCSRTDIGECNNLNNCELEYKERYHELKEAYLLGKETKKIKENIIDIIEEDIEYIY